MLIPDSQKSLLLNIIPKIIKFEFYLVNQRVTDVLNK